MHLLALASILAAGGILCQAQTEDTNTTAPVLADTNHWCGNWAGAPSPSNVPSSGQLPRADYTKRFFVEPQLQRAPFSPVIASEAKVQVPKIWGNYEFRVALLSYTDSTRVYASSKSRWADFHTALDGVMTECVNKGTGGAYLVPPSPGLTQATLTVYAYAVGSYFDYQMNYYMSAPYGINPATIQNDFASSGFLTLLNKTDVEGAVL